MEYSYVHGIKTEPSQGLTGICPLCGGEVFAKCGKIKLHHWAHKNLIDCDTWGEPETQWHRDWKSKFPKDYREVVFTNRDTNEKHRADVHTPKGITIEFQNSPISLDELKSRDEFYKRLIWIVNGEKFKGGFNFTCSIPNPNSPLLNDYVIHGRGRHTTDDILNHHFTRKSEYTGKGGMVRLLGHYDEELKDVFELMKVSQPIYWMFEWKHKHKAWLHTTSPVFFDFGDEFLYWLRARDQPNEPLNYVHIIKKAEFINKYTL